MRYTRRACFRKVFPQEIRENPHFNNKGGQRARGSPP